MNEKKERNEDRSCGRGTKKAKIQAKDRRQVVTGNHSQPLNSEKSAFTPLQFF